MAQSKNKFTSRPKAEKDNFDLNAAIQAAFKIPSRTISAA
jgi:hypothetical protein